MVDVLLVYIIVHRLPHTVEGLNNEKVEKLDQPVT